ncbi:MATE family efflux transporter [Candidatus Saccharibacteria bacterium]|nr:MATE family efflux transporter [Candidatus Saccharibacteria bacterium]
MGRIKWKSVVALANTEMPVKVTAVILAFSTLGAAILGLFRDRWLNTMYLNTYKEGIDAYTAAFSVPDFMFFLLVSGALTVSFIPVFTERLSKGNRKSAWELSSSLLNIMALIMFVVSILIIIFAGPLARLIAPGFSPETHQMTVSLMRVIAVNPLLFSISTVLISMQQAVGRFLSFAMAPIIYNICILIGVRVFTGGIVIFGHQVFDGGIMGVALGVALGSIVQLLIALFGMIGLGFEYNLKIFWKNLGLRKVASLLPARTADQGLDYVATFVNTNLASRMAAGTVRQLQQAQSLAAMPISLVGVAISTAWFPKLSQEITVENGDAFNQSLRTALRLVIWLILPIAVVAFFARGYVAAFIVNGGNAMIAGLLGVLCVSIVCSSIFQILVRAFYANQDTKTPLIVSLISISVMVTIAVLLARHTNLGAFGIVYAKATSAILEITLLFGILHYRRRSVFTLEFVRAVIKMFVAGFFTALTVYTMVRLFPFRLSNVSFMSTFPKFALITGVGFVTYVVAGFFLAIDEVSPIVARVKKVVFRNVA